PHCPDDRALPSPPARSSPSLLLLLPTAHPAPTSARPPSADRSAPLLLPASRPTTVATGTAPSAPRTAAAIVRQPPAATTPARRHQPAAWRALRLPSRTPCPRTCSRPTSSSAADSR